MRQHISPIGHVGDGRQGVHANLMKVGGLRDQTGIERDGQQHEGQSGEEAAGPSPPEGLQGHGARGLTLRQQERGDQVTGQHEKEIDAQVPAGEMTSVKEKDSGDRHASQSIECRDVAHRRAAPRCHGRHRSDVGGIEP
jgi:hypothetical protein